MADCSQRAIAEGLGITNRAISNWERGITQPRLEAWQFVRLCEMLGCTMQDLVEQDGPATKEAIASKRPRKSPRAGRG